MTRTAVKAPAKAEPPVSKPAGRYARIGNTASAFALGLIVGLGANTGSPHAHHHAVHAAYAHNAHKHERVVWHHAASQPAVPAHTGTVALGKAMAARRGWRGQQWICLWDLWENESGWSATARNPSSGAYGVAQALGHGPTGQYPAGPANPPRSSARAQIRWGLSYIRGRYGSPCGAWSAWLTRSPHWY